ncbi:MAG: hypothetical protein KJN63_02160, partial [Acidimicrobiia bacterium]|nr:hypothetical protein [Acidimicrobiia bacterium]
MLDRAFDSGEVDVDRRPGSSRLGHERPLRRMRGIGTYERYRLPREVTTDRSDPSWPELAPDCPRASTSVAIGLT